MGGSITLYSVNILPHQPLRNSTKCCFEYQQGTKQTHHKSASVSKLSGWSLEFCFDVVLYLYIKYAPEAAI